MSSGADDSGGVGHGVDTDPHDVGLAETISPAPGAKGADVDGGAATQTSDERAPDEAIGGRPVSDRLVRAVSRAKIAGQLFATEERVKLGRYHLLELVGSGGMGVVWGAWDPELDRRVAIKLVKATMQSARDRILLEGQALAKLSHPNVVPVFDVGVVDEQVYLVMEWVRGKNLRAYCKEPRSVREIVAVYRDAALGLSAAHHAGLIHRDFKPDNAIRGDDGRVRVLDFGLAREGLKKVPSKDPAKGPDDTPVPSSDLTRGAGTPRYMPPEQAEGGELTPSVDQYAFCVSLREALVGRNADGKDADVPGWLDVIVTRGTAREAKARFPSMDELLRALANDPRSVWRRRAIVTGALGLAGAAFAVGTVRGGASDVEQCGGGKDEIAKTWNDSVRSAVVTHVSSLGEYGKEESKRLDADLTKYAATWANTHRAACLARARSELTPQLYESSVGCLARASAGLQTVINVLSKVPTERLSNAIVAVRELPLVTRCSTAGAGDPVDPPRPEIAADVARIANDVERARVLAFAVEPTAAVAARDVVASAERLDYPDIIAKANLTLGLAHLQLSEPSLAVPPLSRARDHALLSGDNAVAIEAYARELFAVAISPSHELPAGAGDAPAAMFFAEPIAKSLGAGGAFARTLLYNNMGVSRMAATDRPNALRWFDKAVTERQLAAADKNVELARIAGNLALAVDDTTKRTELFAESVDDLTELVGPNHPFTLETRLKSALFVGDPGEAATSIEDVCQRYRRYHPHLRALLERCDFELGWLAEERGDNESARRLMVGVTLPDEPRSRVAAGYVLMFDGKLREAAIAMQHLGEEIEADPALWAIAENADAFLVAAICWSRLGETANAIVALEHSLAILDRAAPTFPVFERRLARTRAELARVLTRDRARTAELAAQAARWYRAAGGYDAIAAEMEALAKR
jgi:serine/threonine protein kinase